MRFAEFESVKRGDRSQYPIAVTTYSVTEHWQTGGQTRTCPALNEAMPEQFVEMSVELAAEKGIENGERVRVFNNRGSVEVMALVTPRFKPFKVNGETVHQVGMTHHSAGRATSPPETSSTTCRRTWATRTAGCPSTRRSSSTSRRHRRGEL